MTQPSQPLSLECPAGYGFFQATPKRYPEDFFGRLVIWEAPRRDQLYILSCDVGDGIGQDRSVIDVLRMGTIKEPDEQVAQWISDSVGPGDLAPYIDAIGHLYMGSDGQEALCAIENNNHGLVTQMELQRHWGYNNFFVWQRWDNADTEKSFTTKIGWETSSRTRPIMLANLVKKIRGDQQTGVTDYQVNSPLTINELRTFRIPPGGDLRDAEAASGCHDDCVMTAAIGLQVCVLMQYGTTEPVDVARRRLQEEKERKAASDGMRGRDFQNTDFTEEEIKWGGKEEGWGLIWGSVEN